MLSQVEMPYGISVKEMKEVNMDPTSQLFMMRVVCYLPFMVLIEF